MSEIGYENQPTSTRPWKINTTSNVEPTSWKTGGGTTTSSMNAVSFGFVATAILISLFLIMAILEHIFRPIAPPPPPTTTTSPSADPGNLESPSKLRVHQQNETTSYRGGVSVLMPGEKYPTCIAKLAPLPCPRQGLHTGHLTNTPSSFPSLVHSHRIN